MIRVITSSQAPALGDLRVMQSGDLVIVASDATDREDWPRVQDALNVAANRGAEVAWSRVPEVPTVPFPKEVQA
ncbi:hypothetical protein [Streptomyces cylindrosporus]|uniref:Uncharacterized protein n=1 Tax=Streptomyces cylindrosporus TaxID=2927583 RepID=A0ABS9Y2W9_9ACTN|nr:hypothetical protein [Streptomyces cylindrosporus]MCI3271046.1 hypothetical protein [Streptomyces cylindrosporus]